MKSDRKVGNLFVVGTDTGVGKTVLSLLLMQFFFAMGHTPFYIKPIQTGCRDPYDTDSDAKFIYQHIESLKSNDPADSVIYCFKNPKAPFFAARDEGKVITFSEIERAVLQKAGNHSPFIESCWRFMCSRQKYICCRPDLVNERNTRYCRPGRIRHN